MYIRPQSIDEGLKYTLEMSSLTIGRCNVRLAELRTGAFRLLAALVISAYILIATLKTMFVIVLTAVVVMVPGTKTTTPFSDEDLSSSTAMLQQELSGWVYGHATDGWITNDYPRSMGLITGFDDPLFNVSTAIGKSNLDSLIAANVASGVICFGYSQGATVATLWLNEHADNKDSAPPAENVSFVLIGSPNRPNGGLLARIPGVYVPVLGVTFNGATPESQYEVTDVIRQYDIFGDFPVDPLNPFSLLNVLAGESTIHGDYIDVDVDDPSNLVEVIGNTTYVMAPAKTLPLADALRGLAAKFGRTETPFIDAMEPALRYLVELGYDRTNQGTTTTFQPGSSIGRFFDTLPQFADTIKQGSAILQSELHSSMVQPPANSQKQNADPQSDVTIDKPEDNSSVSLSTSTPPRGHSRQRVSSQSAAQIEQRAGNSRKLGGTKSSMHTGKRSAAKHGSTGRPARHARS